MKCLLFTIGGMLLLAAAGCEPEAAPPRTNTDELPPNLLVATEPPGAIDVITARKSAQDGDSIVIRGRVGGQKEPLATNRAVMTITDLSLPTCDKTPMDTCKTPWDYCCEPTDEIAAKSVAVQVVGADGLPIKMGLAGLGGIAPLRQIVVAGTARTTAGSDTLVVQAKQIYVIP